MTKIKTNWEKMWRRWNNMHDRCYNQKNQKYHRYGGRGIVVCKEWHSFERFYAFFGDLPIGVTIDRIDNDGPYAPWNCRLASKKEQNRNKSDNRIVEFNGLSLSLGEWQERTGIHRDTIVRRLQRGWSIQEALTIKNSSLGFKITQYRTKQEEV